MHGEQQERHKMIWGKCKYHHHDRELGHDEEIMISEFNRFGKGTITQPIDNLSLHNFAEA